MNIESYIKKGNSFPIILNNKGKKYFVKLRAGMSGKYALLNEWIGNCLANQLGLNAQKPEWVYLDERLDSSDIYIEVRELIEKSYGYNISFTFKNDVVDVAKSALNSLDQSHLKKIFLFDLTMLNVDRSDSNLNLMKNESHLIPVDYESSFLIQELMEQKNFRENTRILQSFRNNPLYQNVSERTIEEFLESLKNIPLSNIVAEIPEEILNKEERDTLLENLNERSKNNWFLKNTLDKIANLKRELPSEIKQRAKANETKFRKRFE